MRKYLLAAVAAAAVTSPAIARDGSPYIGIEGGVLFPKDQDGDVFADFTTTQTPGTPSAPAGPTDTTFEDTFELDYKRGYDIDLIAGYDFGIVRAEIELGYKRAKLDEFGIDSSDLAALNAALNRPSVAPDPGAPGQPALVAGDVEVDGTVKVYSAMINALFDFGNEDGLSFYAGGGAGRARMKAFGDSDSAWAYQLIAGARYALSSNIDLGLKYRYFQTGNIELAEDPVAVAGNPDRFIVGDQQVTVDRTTNAVLFSDFEQKFRSHSLLASLIFNFGAGAPPPPPPPPPPPVVPGLSASE